MADRIFIVGLGSAGQRHARNALALGCEVIGYDPRFSGIGQWSKDLPPITAVTQLEVGLAQHPTGVIVATPPDKHHESLPYILDANLPVLCEKPLCCTSGQADFILREWPRAKLAVGYQLRFTAALRALKAKVDAGDFGTIYSTHAEFASRKWCSGTYEANLLLECSHELDLLRWFLGDPSHVNGFGTHHQCEIDFSGVQATFRLDGMSPGYRRSLTLYGTKGVGTWTFDQTENDAAYVAELQDFLAICWGEKQPECSGNDGWWALRMVEAIRKSGQTGKWEPV